MILPEDQFDDNFVICPYCLHKYQSEPENYSETPRNEECEKCGKIFEVWQEFTVTNYTRGTKQPTDTKEAL